MLYITVTTVGFDFQHRIHCGDYFEIFRNLPPGHDVLLFSTSGTASFICPVAQTHLDITRPLITPSWTTEDKSRWSVFISVNQMGMESIYYVQDKTY